MLTVLRKEMKVVTRNTERGCECGCPESYKCSLYVLHKKLFLRACGLLESFATVDRSHHPRLHGGKADVNAKSVKDIV